MRIHAGQDHNYARILLPEILLNQSISLREFNTPALTETFVKRLHTILQTKHEASPIDGLVTRYMDQAKELLATCSPPPEADEIMAARALVLSNALPVIELLHLEGAEIFISYDATTHETTDWRKYTTGQSAPSIGSLLAAIHIHCGGHPFTVTTPRNQHPNHFLASFMITAARETGHYADMLRDNSGAWTGRHSTTDWIQSPSEQASKSRMRDIRNSEYYHYSLSHIGLMRIMEWERHLQFYRNQKTGSSTRLLVWMGSKLAWYGLRFVMTQRGMRALTTLPASPYPAIQIGQFFEDMRYNLAPQAPHHQGSNADETDALACMEALARVPQQVIKWGHEAVYCISPYLYSMYYSDVVPACEEAAERLKS
jgi:hypothetical protein